MLAFTQAKDYMIAKKRPKTLLFIWIQYMMHIKLAGYKESDARSLRGGGGELGKLKTLTYGFTNFTQR
jgi:hypothetical protein